MMPLVIIFSAIAPLSIVILFHILAKLSRRFGSVLKMTAVYKWYYLAEGLGVVALLAHLWQASTILSPPNTPSIALSPIFILVFHHIPLAAAVTIGLGVTWKYWRWLIIEEEK